MICVWLVEAGVFSSATESLDYFGNRRTDKNVSTKFQGVSTYFFTFLFWIYAANYLVWCVIQKRWPIFLYNLLFNYKMNDFFVSRLKPHPNQDMLDILN